LSQNLMRICVSLAKRASTDAHLRHSLWEKMMCLKWILTDVLDAQYAQPDVHRRPFPW
jgi:hypothetical protein